jgi:lysophospholipase L1-like esterase
MPRKTILALATFIALTLAPLVFPELKKYQWFDPKSIPTVWDLPIPDVAQEAYTGPTVDELRSKRLELLAPSNLVDPNHELDPFYAALLQSGTPDARQVRVLHYGDSPTTADIVTGDVRAMMQKEFGDAGVGFVLAARPWAWYGRRGVEMDGSNWKIDVGGAGDVKDGLFGLGGATFRGKENSVANWKLRPGHRFVEVAYLAQPGGGSCVFEADGAEVGRIETDAAESAPGFATIQLPAGSTKYRLRVTEGTVRLYGVEFRKGSRGVMYSSLGINGAGVGLLARTFNASHWTAQLRHYNPDLVVLAYGTNESGFEKYVETAWEGELKQAVRRLRTALPNTPILLMSPMDRGDKNQDGDIATTPGLLKLVHIEERAAKELGLAFFNTFQAMGGEGTMARWYAAQPRLVGADFIHPLPAGGKIVGELLYRALGDGFNDYKLRQLSKIDSGQPEKANHPSE